MKLIDDIMDAMGIIDEVEEEDKPRKPKEEKKVKEEQAEEKPRRFAKPAVKEAEKADEAEEEDDLAEMSTKDKITALFSRKKPAEAKAEDTAAEEEKPEPTKRRLNFNFTNKKAEAPAEAAPVAKPEAAPTARPAAPRRPAFPTMLGEVNMQVLEPANFDDSQKVADALHNSQPVVVNFENTDPVVAKRMTDFISGVIYALQGNMKKVGRNILICAPKNVDIDSGLGNEYRSDDQWK